MRATNSGGVSVTVNRIAKWNGSSWSALGSGMDSQVGALATSSTDLYAGGSFVRATNNGGVAVTVNRIAKWNGSNWAALGSGMDIGGVTALAVSGGDVYAGGTFYNAGGIPARCIAKWDGNAWSPLGLGVEEFSPSVMAIALSGSDVYAGGDFTFAGGKTAYYIAKWDGSSWSKLGSGMDSRVMALVMTGTNLYAGGNFTAAGFKISAYIAKANIGAARGRFSNVVYFSPAGFNCTFLDGTIGQPYRIQSSSSLSGPWVDFTNFTYSGPIVITDGPTGSADDKFFRATTP